MVLAILFLVLLFSSVLCEGAVIEPMADASLCNRTCGEIYVPYPFGFGNSSECFKDDGFQLVCNQSTLQYGGNELLNISLEEGIVTVLPFVAIDCKGLDGYDSQMEVYTPFTFSSTRNTFTTIGCNTEGKISDGGDETSRFASGCLSLCRSGTVIPTLDFLKQNVFPCTGIGCCQTPVPSQLKKLDISLTLYDKNVYLSDNRNCSYGFLSDSNFTLKESPDSEASGKDIPDRDILSVAVLDWAIGEMTCEEAISNGTEYICGPNTDCINSTNGPGYRCLCKDGFKGNPYEKTGCADIDECLSRDVNKYPCKGICKNTNGSYTCECKFGFHGDAKVGCSMKTISKILLGVGAFVVLIITVVVSLWLFQKKIKWSNRRRNGGLLLEQFTLKTFEKTQLEKATDNFHAKQLLGEGGNGWVYRGLLPDTTEIAVKKSKEVDQNQIEQFLNEADIVSKINHKNVVKLMGVCLDSHVPMLVYEFVSNGTLYQHLHGRTSRVLDSWRICVRIAAESARALDYMHSQARTPIIHRDVKSSNILLDGRYTAKVADFGASKLIRTGRTIAATQGQGTMGYMDPEYLQTGELTTMSDVYGFGVVLMELLSKQKPISKGPSGEMVGLVKVFTSAVENNHFDQVLRVAEVGDHETEQVHLVAKLAVRCVAMPSTRRPTMTEVVDVLNGMSKEYTSFPVEGSGHEVVSLLDDQDVMTTSVHFELEFSK